MDKIEILYKTRKTVFSIHDLRLLWEETNPNALKSSIAYFVSKNKLIRIRNGIYALEENFNHLELAQRLITPSYLSLSTALQFHGIVYQAQAEITSFALYNRSLTVANTTFKFHQMSPSILINPQGIAIDNRFSMASPERAICDWVYLNGLIHFDNFSKINTTTLKEMALIYNNKSVVGRINTLIKKYAD